MLTSQTVYPWNDNNMWSTMENFVSYLITPSGDDLMNSNVSGSNGSS